MSFDYVAAFKEIANGDQHAFDFMVAIYDWVHILDDKVDGDKDVPADLWVQANLVMLNTGAGNPFFQKHAVELLSVMRLAAHAWLASERFAKSDDIREKMAAQVLKSQYQDIFFAVAYRTGGWPHQKAMAEKYRGYDWG